ncbi:unnamed protein product [Chironomus riparius]|uniref:Uncharacterized protein n=1 Tax=Chironomus riparius TaxID=315576 RepID=A0A9P0IWI5_9DIPT|nr:unnamed protein product [Chironomus riparius]
MNKLVVIFVLLSLAALCFARPATQDSSIGVPYNEEIVVHSSLNIRNKPQNRQKRQFGPYHASNALANANSYGQYMGPQGFGATSGIAGAQAFKNQGPMGGFGASAANTGTQGFNCGPGGCAGSAGMSGSQTYDLPGGRHINLGYGGTFSNAGGQPAYGQSNSINFS